MPAKKRHPTPPEQLLAFAKVARAEGIPFDVFWDRMVPAPVAVMDRKKNQPILDDFGDPKVKPSRVLPRVTDDDPPTGTVLWPHDTRERRDAYEAAVSCREAWRRSYENLPASPSERAVRRIAPDPVGGRSPGAGVPLPA